MRDLSCPELPHSTLRESLESKLPTAEVGVTLRKGEELSYFQFGGSDIIVLFEASMNVNLSAKQGQHYKMGAKIGEAYPVI